MTQIRLIPMIYMKGQKASLSRDGSFTEEALAWTEAYNQNGADGLLAVDVSDSDALHEASIACFKQILRETELRLYLGGGIRRFEDVKKYLYTGADMVLINSLDQGELSVLKEATDRFSDRVKAVPYEAEVYTAGQLADQPELARSNEELLFVSALAGTDFFMLKQTFKQAGIPVLTYESDVSWEQLKLDGNGLIPCIVQDYRTDEVLMMAYMNQEAFLETLRGGRLCYYSRSRNERWLKGETSEHYQYLKSLHLDCDNDALLAKVAQVGAACHTGAYSCFYKTIAARGGHAPMNPHKVLNEVYNVIQDRQANPKEGSYTNYLFDKGIDKILKKCGEEAAEIIIAAKNPDPEEIKYEISDFLYHVMVLMVLKGVAWEDIMKELANR